MNEVQPLECCQAYEPSWFQNLKWSWQNKLKELKYKRGINKRPESSFILHAKREFLALGYKPIENCDDDPNKWIQENVIELLEVFSKQGHSGFSGPYAIDIFSKLAKYEPLCPLTGNDDEWNDVCDEFYQNNRCSHVFKDKPTGRSYDIQGFIFKDQHGSCFTSGYSRKYIDFPYVPSSEYIDVICTETNKEGTVEHPGSGWWETKYPDWLVELHEAYEK